MAPPTDPIRPAQPPAANAPENPDASGGRSTSPPSSRPDLRGYWRANIRFILILLSIWAAVSYGCSILFVEQLNEFTIGNLPLGFWFAQQGSIYVFIVLILVYALRMDRLDRKYGLAEQRPRKNPPPSTLTPTEREHDEERNI